GLSPGVDGEGVAKFANPAAYALFYLTVAVFAIPRKPFDDFCNQSADFPELGGAESARRPGRGAEADARGDERATCVERDAVLVAGQPGPVESGLGRLAGYVLGRQVDQHQVVVGPARDDPQARLLEARG